MLLESHRAVWHREPEAGVITAWLAAACTCAGRSMAGSLAGLRLIFSPTPRPACSKSSTTAYLGRRLDGSKGPAKLSVENYGHGSDACYNSWTILSRSIPVV